LRVGLDQERPGELEQVTLGGGEVAGRAAESDAEGPMRAVGQSEGDLMCISSEHLVVLGRR
jgi:hypothetical protein